MGTGMLRQADSCRLEIHPKLCAWLCLCLFFLLLSLGLLIDSLANAEAVRLFTAEKEELRRFQAVQKSYAEQSVRVTETLSFLNFGQQFIFHAGMLASLVHTANQVALGLLPVGHLVLVSSLLLQVKTPLPFFFFVRSF